MTKRTALAGGVVGGLAVVEFTSGVIQGYYTPLYSDIARRLAIHDADINWLEAVQLLLSAIVVPVLARLGDMYGHRRVLLGTLAVTGASAWGVALAPSFPVFLALWATMGFYVVWLPLNVAIIYARARRLPDTAALTRRASGVIVVALQAGAISGALAAGQLGDLLKGTLWLVLAVPAALITVAFLVVWRFVADPGERSGGRVDTRGAVVLSLGLLAITGGLSLVRLAGVTPLVVGLVVMGIAVVAGFVLLERRTASPLIDMRLVTQPALWPVFLTSALIGVSLLGAQGALSTFVRTDRGVYGYGLSLTSATASYLIGAYVLSLLVGAATFARMTAATTPRLVLMAATGMIALGYLALVVLHDNLVEVTACMVLAGLGSGALVAALPAAAAAAAPLGETAMATGLTNTTKTIGGSFASSAFALALVQGVTTGTAAPMSGYVTVWLICSGTALVALLTLLAVPKVAFTSSPASHAIPGEEVAA
ncbi:MAG TPA: MFS transporter [Propionibacteriaceae bacterium]|nr:MFS transporter [Propionibacteriaceae bacterium]